jgi:acid phosphatase (class A)
MSAALVYAMLVYLRMHFESAVSCRRRDLRRPVLCLFLLLGLAAPLVAGSAYLPPGRPDGVALLAPPPAAGSGEAAADLASARAVFDGRTPAEEARAFKDASLAFSLFTPAIGAVFTPARLPKTHALLSKVRKEVGPVIDACKDHWKRLRPYQLDPHLSLREPESSSGYPSGHSTRGTVYSLLLAELFPDKQEDILRIGRNLGWDRVLIGKHFPTDIQAGRVLGKAIIRELFASPDFQKDLAEARAEIQAAQSEAAQPAEKALAPADR